MAATDESRGSGAIDLGVLVTGRALALLRMTLDITQDDLAARADLHVSTIQKYESGARSPRADALGRILAAMDLDHQALEYAERLVHYIFVRGGRFASRGATSGGPGEVAPGFVSEPREPYGEPVRSGRELVEDVTNAIRELGFYLVDRRPISRPSDGDGEP